MLRTIEFYLIIKYYMGQAHIISNKIGWRHGVFFLNILGSAALVLVAKLEEMGSG